MHFSIPDTQELEDPTTSTKFTVSMSQILIAHSPELTRDSDIDKTCTCINVMYVVSHSKQGSALLNAVDFKSLSAEMTE